FPLSLVQLSQLKSLLPLESSLRYQLVTDRPPDEAGNILLSHVSLMFGPRNRDRIEDLGHGFFHLVQSLFWKPLPVRLVIDHDSGLSAAEEREELLGGR